MEFRDLKRQYQKLKPAIDQAILSTLASGNYIMGESVKNLENTLAQYVGVKHCLTCSNGTDALTLALKAWNIGEGDAVFVPDFTFFATAESVAREGATPVFVDVCPDSYNINPNSLNKAIKAIREEGRLQPKAIVAVDLFGLPADYLALRQLSQIYQLPILEDAAQGFGGRIGNKQACSFGDIAITSFFPAKPLGCYGDGGALFTNCEKWANDIDSYRQHGKGKDKYDNIRIGLNSRLDTIQASILQVKLNAFQEHELESIQKAAKQYHQLLSDLKDMVSLPISPTGYYSSWAQYTIQLSSEELRTKVYQYLREQDIPCMVYYPKTMSQQKAFAQNRQYVETPIAQSLCKTVLSIPIHPYITIDEIEQVSKAIHKVILH
ncbi:MAG: DegT/DnrJ/EryC1/StrS family aminotransferase [Bacteroidales bacterium]|nr:DegT/DnrJ/EryC1/StrS family aminotransferase [Bacteroidales bacterium]